MDNLSIAQQLAGKRIFVTGATGFIGTALVERVLSSLPDTRLVLLIRPRGSRPAEQRIRDLLGESAFTPLRERWGKTALERAVVERVSVIEGDLTTGEMRLPADIDVVIHCASDITFDHPYDTSFDVNVLGSRRLYDAVVASGSRPHLVHVSTAYVAGLRRGPILENPVSLVVRWEAEARALVHLRSSVEADSRRPELLSRLTRVARAEHGGANPMSVTQAVEQARQEWVTSQLVRSGRVRANSLGYPDVYGLTKAFGEQVVEGIACAEGLSVSLIRPAITESALAKPFPGWIKGIKMAEPIIHAFGRGDLPETSAPPDGALDVLPVDFVVNAILAASARAPLLTPAYYHLVSGSGNPLRFRHLYNISRRYYADQPILLDGRPVAIPHWRFPGAASAGRGLRLAEWAIQATDQTLGWLPIASARARRVADSIDRQRRRLQVARRLFDLFGPYVGAEMTFLDHNTRALLASLHDADRAAFDFDCRHINWEEYLLKVHFPAVRRQPHPPRAPRQHPLPRRQARQVLAVFDLEGTLLDATVVETYLWSRLRDLPIRSWPGELVDVGVRLPGLVSTEHGDRAQFLRSFYRRYRGASVDDLERLVDDELAPLILRRLAPAGIRRIREHRESGHRTVLLTGALDIFTRPLVKLFDDVQAAQLAVADDGRFSGDLEAPPLVGEARVAWLEAYAHDAAADLADAYAYADSFSDVPLLARVGKPTAVNPDVRLYRVARRRRWVIEDWRAKHVQSAEGVR